jgi:hypothetical protein
VNETLLPITSRDNGAMDYGDKAVDLTVQKVRQYSVKMNMCAVNFNIQFDKQTRMLLTLRFCAYFKL